MGVRDLRFRLSLSNEIGNQLVEVKKQLLDVAGTTAEALVRVKVVGREQIGAAKVAAENAGKSMSSAGGVAGTALTSLTTRAQGVRDSLSDMKDRGADAFKEIQSCSKDLDDSLGRITKSLLGVAAGGAVAGISWKTAVEDQLSQEQTFAKFTNDKKFKKTGEELKTWSAGFADAGWTRPMEMTSLADTVYSYGGKRMAGDKGLQVTEQLARVKAGRVGGLGTSDEMFMRLLEQSTPLADRQKMMVGDALGVSKDDSRLQSRAAREKLLAGVSQSDAIQKGIDTQPWINANNAIKDLTNSLGMTLAPTMAVVVGGLASFIRELSRIPGVSIFLALAAGAVSLVGGLSLLVNVGTALKSGFGMLCSIWSLATSFLYGKTAATVDDTAATAAETVTTTTLTGSLMAAAAAMELAATAMMSLVAAQGAGEVSGWSLSASEGAVATTNTALAATAGTAATATATQAVVNNVAGFSFKALAMSIWSAVAPLLLIIVPLLALGAVLYYVESKTHIFSNALKTLGKSEMAHDVLDWFKGVGHWINDSIRGLDQFYKALKGGALGSMLGGGLKIAGTLLMGPFGLILKPLIDLMTNSVEVQNVIRKLIEIGLTIFQKIADFTLWVWHGILDLTKKISDFLEKITGKSAAKTDAAKEATAAAQPFAGALSSSALKSQVRQNEFTGDHLAEADDSIIDIAYKIATHQQTSKTEMDKLHRYGDGSLQKELLNTVQDLVNNPGKYKLSPEEVKASYASFAPPGTPGPLQEGVGQNFATATNNINQLEATQGQAGTTPTAGMVAPFMQPLVGAYNYLVDRLPKGETSDEKTVTTPVTTDVPIVDPAEKRSRHIADLVTAGMPYPEAETQATKEGYASGFTVQSPGRFTGNLHGKEELLNQAQVSKGPGPISKVLAELYDFKGQSNGDQSNQSQQYAPAPITVNFYNSISRDVDVDSFMFKARGELERLTTRNGGYRRGGAVGR